mmetsp:Transcript_110770/g.294241  ORF Transcript_110770/g.294241 Transcript_110770/m.294241 type:complete len:519 (-) Transcript_110770:92-1648(-)
MSLVDTSQVEAQVEALGCGRYQFVVFAAVGTSFLIESLEMGAVSPLHTALGHAFNLSRGERIGLAALTYAGSMGGMFCAGPIADCYGRKTVLAAGNLIICISSCLHAVVPLHTPSWLILALRLLQGVGGAVVLPTGYTLAAESTPIDYRLKMGFGISFLGTIGYLLEALAIQWFMPHFGEKDSDNWRGFCLFIGLPALLALPLVFMIVESPTFLAINERWDDCEESLRTMAAWNKVPESAASTEASESLLPRRHMSCRPMTTKLIRWPSVNSLIARFLPVMVVLTLMDASKSFFTSGSAYLCKDLFELTRHEMNQFSPAALNAIASGSPLLGLILGERMVGVGVRMVMLIWSVVAFAALCMMAIGKLRACGWLVLTLVIVYKLAYGPMGTCLAMMKVQAFPTEFRASAFAIICVGGRLLCALGPVLLEALKPHEDASSWNPKHLSVYILSLAVAALVSGLLVLKLPAMPTTRLRSLSSTDLHSLDEEDSDTDAVSPLVKRSFSFGRDPKAEAGERRRR